VQIRSAIADDLVAVVDIASVVDPPADDAEVDVGYYRHLLEHGRVVVAEGSGIVIGYAAVIEIGAVRHVSDLFLHQDAQGQGIGRRLLEAAWDAGAAPSPRQTFSSLHSAALPLYVRAGMAPMWPLLYLTGSSAALPRSDLEVSAVDEGAAAAYEAEWLGWDRSREYGYWARRPGARIFVVRDAETQVAVGCTVRNRMMHTLSRLVCAEGSMMPEVAAAAARWCGDDVLMSVPGTNRAVPMLMNAGWRVVEHDLYCASEPGLMDPERLLPHPGLV
jgi:GNAT superfamily N-acetyltransferase